MSVYQQVPWYELENETELASSIESLAAALDDDYSGRDEHDRKCISLYEGRQLSEMSPLSYHRLAQDDRDEDRPLFNYHRSGCDTVHAEIAGRQKPKPMYLTRGGDYMAKRRAKRRDKFVEAQLKLPQGSYANGWAVVEDAFLDAEVCGYGIVLVSEDSDSIRYERVLQGQLRVDLEEAAHGEPRNWFHTYPMDRGVALRRFIDEDADESDTEDDSSKSSEAMEREYERSRKEQAIRSAKLYESKHRTMRKGRVCPPIQVIEAWHTPYDDADEGRHVVVINGCVVLDEPWDRRAPFLILRWAKERVGFWGVGIIDEGLAAAAEANKQFTKLSIRQELCGAKRTYYTPGSIELDDLESNEHEQLIPVQAGAQHPTETVPQPVAASEVDWAEAWHRRFFELTGISQMSAASRKDPGITAAVAIRTATDLQSKRFAAKMRAYEYAYVELAHLTEEAAKAIAARSPDFKLPFPGSDFTDEIAWKDIDREGEAYVIDVQPASTLPDTPQGRQQLAQELLSQGLIGKDAYIRILDMPDLESEFDVQNAERERIEWEIARMLDAEPDKPFEMHSPDGYILDHASALQRVALAYNQAIMEGAPNENLELLRGYLRMLETMIERASAPPAEAGGALPPAPPGMQQEVPPNAAPLPLAG